MLLAIGAGIIIHPHVEFTAPTSRVGQFKNQALPPPVSRRAGSLGVVPLDRGHLVAPAAGSWRGCRARAAAGTGCSGGAASDAGRAGPSGKPSGLVRPPCPPHGANPPVDPP